MERHYANITGVEIFKVGTHNGDTYSSQDIDDMIDAFHKLDYQPALKLGHDKSPGAPAVGYITKLWRSGDTMMANFEDIPEAVFSAIKKKLFNRVSAEIYFNFQRAGKTYRRALKALALLGAEVPGVAGLRPLADSFAGVDGDLRAADAAFSTDQAMFVVSAARKQSQSDHGANNMDKDLKQLEDSINALTASLEEEKSARNAAEEKLAELEAQHKSGSEDDDTLKKTASSLSADQRSTKIAELNAKLSKAQDALQAEREARQAAEQRSESLEARTRKLEESRRADRIEDIAEQCVVPSLRPYVRAFADLATRQAEVRVFNADTEKEEDAVNVVERMIKFVNGNAERIFTVVSREDNAKRGYGDVAAEVDRRVKKYMSEHAGVEYKDAMATVLNADEVLKQEYAAA